MPFGGYPVFRRLLRNQPVKASCSSRRLPRPSRASDSTTPRRATETITTPHCKQHDTALATAEPTTSSVRRRKRRGDTAALPSIRRSSAHKALQARPRLSAGELAGAPKRSNQCARRRRTRPKPQPSPRTQAGFAKSRPELAHGVSTPSASRVCVRAERTGTEAPARTHPSTCRAVRVCFIPETLLSFHLQGVAPSGDSQACFQTRILPCRWAKPPRRRRNAARTKPPSASEG